MRRSGLTGITIANFSNPFPFNFNRVLKKFFTNSFRLNFMKLAYAFYLLYTSP